MFTLIPHTLDKEIHYGLQEASESASVDPFRFDNNRSARHT